MTRILYSAVVLGAAALAMPAMAADFVEPAVAPVEVPAATHDWSGLYVGVVAGYTSASSDTAYDNPALSAYDVSSTAEGFGFGVTAGANFVLDSSLVVGIEGDLSVTDITGTFDDELANLTPPTGQTVTTTTDYAGTLRGRVGVAIDNWLPYATAGVAFAHTITTATDGDLEDDATMYGLIAGVGIEVALDESLSLKAEYLHTELQDNTWYEGEVYSSTGGVSSDTIRVGLNFAF